MTFEVVTRFGLPGREVSAKAALVNFTMMQHYFGVANVDGAYWSLVLQINFYIAVSVLILFRSRLTMFRFAGAWLAALFSLRGFHALGYFDSNRNRDGSDHRLRTFAHCGRDVLCAAEPTRSRASRVWS